MINKKYESVNYMSLHEKPRHIIKYRTFLELILNC